MTWPLRLDSVIRQALRMRTNQSKRLPRLFLGFSQSWEIRNDHPLASHRRDSGKRRAILAMQIAHAQIRSPYQFIPFRELENLIGLEHPNSVAGRIKSEEICSRTVAVLCDSLPDSVEFRNRSHSPVILTGGEEHATSRE